MLGYIYKYSYSGELYEKQHIDDIELILFNNRIPYKLEKTDKGLKVYVSLMHEEVGRVIVENLKSDNLIYRKAINYEDYNTPRRRNIIKKFEYRKVMIILFLLIFIVLFMRSLLLLNIMN
ncbi:MAG: hypothetical protein WBA54_06530 [Acidaminobacteraceae bacterium]